MLKIFEVAIYDLSDRSSSYPRKCFHSNIKAENYNKAYEFGEEIAFRSGGHTKKMLFVHEFKNAEQPSLF